MWPSFKARVSLVLLAGAGLSSTLLAQQTPPVEPPKESQPAAPTKPETPAPALPEAKPAQPSLDDLLGIPKDKKPTRPDAKPRPEAGDPTKSDLERKLSAREVAEQFKQAVDLMGDTAQRIQASRDTGLATQRIQEDIIRKLDQLIKAAEQNQQQQSRSSRSQRPQDQQQQQPQQQQGQQRNPNGNEAAPDTADPPGRQGEHLNPGAAARGAAWGNLPNRLRDALLQGNADKYSSWYQQWTESYYKRLAEDANK